MSVDIESELSKLFGKPSSYQFTDKEIAFIKKHENTARWKIHYVLYARKSNKGKYVGIIIDYLSDNPRDRKPEHYSMKVICSRDMNAKEKMWEYQNYGTKRRRFVEYWYENVESVILMDKHYNIETPKEFIELCQAKGYTGGVQLGLKFE